MSHTRGHVNSTNGGGFESTHVSDTGTGTVGKAIGEHTTQQNAKVKSIINEDHQVAPERMPPGARLAVNTPLFLASTVSALHRNAHIWNASQPLLVTYYCWVIVYSSGMEAKKVYVMRKRTLHAGFEPGFAGIKIQGAAICAMRTVVPNGSYWTVVSNASADYFKLRITILLTERKNAVNAKNNESFTYLLFKLCVQV